MENSDGETTTTFNGGNPDDKYSSNTKFNNNSHFKTPRDQTHPPPPQSLYVVVSSLLSSIFFPDPDSSSSFFQRTKDSLVEYLPRLKDASKTTGYNVLHWARRGSCFRLLLVISVGTITLLTLTGVLVFFLFLAAATVNTIILSLFVSLAAAGGFLAIFFACVAAIYIGAMSIAFFVISATTISAIITVFIVTGWIGFFWIIWTVASKSASFAKHSVTFTGSAVTAYASGWQRHHHHD